MDIYYGSLSETNVSLLNTIKFPKHPRKIENKYTNKPNEAQL